MRALSRAFAPAFSRRTAYRHHQYTTKPDNNAVLKALGLHLPLADTMSDRKPMTPRASSSVVLAAPDSTGPGYKILFLERSAKSSFMPSTYVFPGGAVDKADSDPAWAATYPGHGSALALRVAAAREAFEESGVLLHTGLSAATAAGDAARFADARTRVHDDARTFLPFLREHGLTLDLDARNLQQFSRFVTPVVERKRFDATFYLYALPCEPPSSPDLQETVRQRWLGPADALAAMERGDLALAPPQWWILSEMKKLAPRFDQLATFPDDPRRAIASATPIQPHVVPSEEGPPCLVLPHDEEHPQFPGTPGAKNRIAMGVNGGADSGAPREKVEGVGAKKRMLFRYEHIRQPGAGGSKL